MPRRAEAFDERRESRAYLCLGETRCGQAQSDVYAAAPLSAAAATRT